MDYDTLEADRRFSIRLADELARERAKELNIKLPEHRRVTLITDVAYGMMLVDTLWAGNTDVANATLSSDRIRSYLCSPLGYIEVPTWCHTVWEAAKEIGLKIPHKKDKRTWENIEPYWVAVALSKL